MTDFIKIEWQYITKVLNLQVKHTKNDLYHDFRIPSSPDKNKLSTTEKLPLIEFEVLLIIFKYLNNEHYSHVAWKVKYANIYLLHKN